MGRDLALDLGTANTLVYRAGSGIVFDEPTVVALDMATGRLVGTGDHAWEMIGGPSGNVVASRPLRHGVITDFDTTQQMIQAVLKKVGIPRFPKPRVLACVPIEASEVERRAVEEAVDFAGGGDVTLVDEPLVAAIGAGLPIAEPVGSLVVDIGGGTTQAAILSLGGIINGRSVPVGGFDLDEAIRSHVLDRYGVQIGEAAAERLKIELGSAVPSLERHVAAVTGREILSGAPRDLTLDDDEIRTAMSGGVAQIAACVRRVLAEAPPELTHDVLESGMFLTGGGSMLRGLDLRLAEECEVPVHLSERPRETVILGAGSMVEHLEDYRASFQFTRRRSVRDRRN